MPNGTDDDTSSCTSGSLSVLLAFGELVTFTATVSQNSPPASPEPVTHAGWGPWEVALGGHSSSYANPSSFQIVSAGHSPLESDYSGAAPGEDVMCQNNLKIGDDFIIIDYKPTESLKADDNFLVIDWLAEDHFKVDPSDPSVDPTNPNVDLRPMETPGPDDNVGLPAVQIGGVSVASGDVNGDTDAIGQTVTFTYTVNVDPSAYDDYDRDQQLIAIHTRTGNATLETESHLLYQDVFVPTLETGPAVAMETLTIADEGFWF